MADPQRPVKTTSFSLYGQAVSYDKVPKAPHPLPQPGSVSITSAYEAYTPSEDVDYTDLSSVNRELQLLRMRLHRLRIELKEAERKALKAKYFYEGQKKRTLVGLSGGSAGEREAMAELICEEAYTDSIVAAMVAKEITNHNRDLRTELEALREISNNLRRQIDLQ